MTKLGFRFSLLILFSTALLTTACNQGGSNQQLGGVPTTTTASILSDQAADGEIYLALNATAPSVSPPVPNLYAGVDITQANYGDEYRAFLDFPLDGSTNYPVIPSNAIIDSATLDFNVNTVESESTVVPIYIDLVFYDPVNGLVPADYDSAEYARISILPSISINEANTTISVDVTVLMEEAQARGLTDFQLRILEDLHANFYGIINIDDSSNQTAPQLTVTYH